MSPNMYHYSSKCERLKHITAVVESTPLLPDLDTVKSFLSSQQRNFGIIDVLYKFVKLMSLHYDHKWYVHAVFTYLH